MPKFSFKLIVLILGFGFIVQTLAASPDWISDVLSRTKTTEKTNTEEIKEIELQISQLNSRLEVLKNNTKGGPTEKLTQSEASTALPSIPAPKPQTESQSETRQDNKPLKRQTWTPGKSHLDDPFFGSGEVVFMAFLDLQCKPCQAFLRGALPVFKLKAKKESFKFIIRDFPLTKNRASRRLAQSVACAGEQGRYWELLENISNYHDTPSESSIVAWAKEIDGLDHQSFKACLGSKRYKGEIDRDIEEGKKLGVVGAPGFFLGKTTAEGNYSGYAVRGAQPNRVFELLLERLSKDAA